MPPRSLLFSSNEETSRQLRQALQELDLQVEHCPEIFSAVEKLTSQAFDVIAVDWDEGAEASFLLETARELKSNQSAFAIAILNVGDSISKEMFGVNVVLYKPVLSDQIKYSLLTCDEFLICMRTWLARVDAASGSEMTAPQPGNRDWPVAQATELAAEQLECRAASVSSSVGEPSGDERSERTPYFDHGDVEIFGASFQSLFRPVPKKKVVPARKPRDISRFLLIAAAGVAFLAAGYAFSQSTGQNPVALALVKTYDRVVHRASKLVHKPGQDADENSNDEEATDDNQVAHPRNGRITRIRVVPVHNGAVQTNSPVLVAQAAPNELAPQSSQPDPSSLMSRRGVPESLRTPPLEHRADDSTPNASMSTRLAGMLQPVSLTEDLAQKLLVEKVMPSYPVQALQARLQGPVVLEARIGRDGAIRELKLIHGSLLLGKAACEAVKRWRYKPYLLNGQAVEAQTFVTVDFRLPSETEIVQR